MSATPITRGKYVQFTYSIADRDGTILEQSDLPMGYIHRSEQIGLIPSVEHSLEGKHAGEVVEVIVPPRDGFGEHDPNLTYTDDLDNVPEQFRRIGAQVEMQNESGEVRTFFVSGIERGKLTIDGNHPFAGKTVVFTIRVLEVRDPTDLDQQAPAMQTIQSSCAIN